MRGRPQYVMKLTNLCFAVISFPIKCKLRGKIGKKALRSSRESDIIGYECDLNEGASHARKAQGSPIQQ